MKKNITRFIFIYFLFGFFVGGVLAYDDCPRGLVNDPYPGQCANYVDTDHSGFCDHSETLVQKTTSADSNVIEKKSIDDLEDLITGQDLKKKTVSEVAELYDINTANFIRALKQEMNIPNISPGDTFQLLHDNYGVEPSKVKEIASQLSEGIFQFDSRQRKTVQTRQAEGKNYNFGVISVITIVLYLISYTAVKMKRLSLATHRKLWNMLLGIHFFVTAILGILLVLRISYGFVLPVPFNMLFWHVEAGIVFALIAVFHIAWHWPYFKAMIQRKVN